MDVTSVINMQMTQGEETTDINMDLDMKMADINTENMRYLAKALLHLWARIWISSCIMRTVIIIWIPWARR